MDDNKKLYNPMAKKPPAILHTLIAPKGSKSSNLKTYKKCSVDSANFYVFLA